MNVCLIIVAFFIAFVNAAGENGRCLLYRGKCVDTCPHSMFPYHTRCDRDTQSQRTCDSPYVFNLGYTCGWSRCDCIGELVLDDTTGHCVDIKSCPDSTKLKPRHTRRKSKSEGKRIKLKVHDNDDVEFIAKNDKTLQ